MGIMVACNHKKGPIIHESFLFRFLKEMLHGLIYPIHAAHGYRALGSHGLRHVFVSNPIIGIRLVHIKGLRDNKE